MDTVYQNLVHRLQDDFKRNPVRLIDGYTLSHFELKEDLSWETAHVYNRAAPMIMYGVNQIYLDILTRQITTEMVQDAEKDVKRDPYNMHFPSEMWYSIVDKLNGYLPIRVQFAPEGMWLPKGTPFCQIRNTIEGYGELPSWYEAMITHSYFSCGCATEAFHIRRYLDSKELPPNRVHNFGLRGNQNMVSAHYAGTGWNLFLTGTDDVPSLEYTLQAPMTTIPATAHKTMQQFDIEMNACKRAIDIGATYKQKTVAIVIDTYDPWRVIKHYIPELLAYAKERGVHIVFRPDSGDGIEQALAIWTMYGDNKNWSVILGEKMSFEAMKKNDIRLEKMGFPLSRFFVGIGAGFYNHINRDTLGFSMKSAFSNGKPRMKVVKSDPFKQSIPGNVSITLNENMDIMVEIEDENDAGFYYNGYDYNGTTEHPVIEPKFWEHAYARAQHEITKPNLQQEIVIGDKLQQLITKYKERYD